MRKIVFNKKNRRIVRQKREFHALLDSADRGKLWALRIITSLTGGVEFNCMTVT